MKKDQNKKPEIRKTEQTLKCILTQPELLQAGKDMADARELLRELETDLDRFKKDINSKIVTEEGKITTNASKIRSGYEFRSVPCEVHFDVPATGKKTIYRLDTNEVVETREMSTEEKQRMLDLNGEGEE